MIEDIQIGGMQQSQISTTSPQTQITKRPPSSLSHLQLDGDRSRNSNAGALGKQYNRRSKHHKQVFKREISTKNTKKSLEQGLDGTKGKTYNIKYNADTLLNFNYTSSRAVTGYNSLSNGKQRRRRTTFNKETFLQANCKFVVDWDEEKYTEQIIDPDILVDWNVIQLVYLPTHENPKCPICLYPPSAAKMTRCGHTYCWSCVLHYLSLTDKTWNKCPICHEAVHEKDLKSVIPIIQKKFSRIDDITMNLMVRSKDSLCAVPYSYARPSTAAFPVWEGQPFNSSSSKLLLATPEMVVRNILEREKTELTAQLHEALQENTGEEVYTRMALAKLEERFSSYFESTKEHGYHSMTVVVDDTKENPHSEHGIRDSNQFNQLSQLLSTYEENEKADAFSDEEENSVFDETSQCATEEEFAVDEFVEEFHSLTTNTEERDHSFTSLSETHDDVGRNLKKEKIEEDCYYFYQAEDGQNIFINSLNARCLIEEYGSLAEGPQAIVGQILDFESFTMTPELRKRFRYLSHIPLACEFIICELMLRPPILSKHTIHNFMPEFKKRKALRTKKNEEQRKFDMKAQAEQSRQAGFRVSNAFYPEVHLNLSDMNDFPSNLSPEEVEEPIANDHHKEEHQKGPSFAQMLKTSSSNGTTLNSAWGKSQKTRKQETSSIAHKPLNNHVIDDEDDGPNVVAPTLREMFCAATESLHIATEKNNNDGTTTKRGKGKKKSKGTLLFATGAQRKY